MGYEIAGDSDAFQLNSESTNLLLCGDRRFKKAVLDLLRVIKSGTNQPAAVAGV